MRTYQYLYGTGGETIQNLLALLALHDARQQFYSDIHPFQKFTDGLQMLFGKNLGRCHEACLVTVVQGYEHSHQRHERLARTHVALQQTVHLLAAAHVGSYLVHHPFLGARQFEGQVVVIEAVEDVADAIEYVAAVFAALVARIP